MRSRTHERNNSRLPFSRVIGTSGILVVKRKHAETRLWQPNIINNLLNKNMHTCIQFHLVAVKYFEKQKDFAISLNR